MLWIMQVCRDLFFLAAQEAKEVKELFLPPSPKQSYLGLLE